MVAQCPKKPLTLRGIGTKKSQRPPKTKAWGVLDILSSNANPEAPDFNTAFEWEDKHKATFPTLKDRLTGLTKT